MLVYQDLLTGACAVLFLCPDLFFPFFFFPPSGAGLGLGEEEELGSRHGRICGRKIVFFWARMGRSARGFVRAVVLFH